MTEQNITMIASTPAAGESSPLPMVTVTVPKSISGTLGEQVNFRPDANLLTYIKSEFFVVTVIWHYENVEPSPLPITVHLTPSQQMVSFNTTNGDNRYYISVEHSSEIGSGHVVEDSAGHSAGDIIVNN